MIERLRQARENEEGFTLIELLVVIIIVGILAAIAIPVFLNQRNKGFDSAVRADLRNSATAQETWLTDNAGYTNNVGDLETVGFKYSAAKNYSGGVASLSATTAGTTTACRAARPPRHVRVHEHRWPRTGGRQRRTGLRLILSTAFRAGLALYPEWVRRGLCSHLRGPFPACERAPKD